MLFANKTITSPVIKNLKNRFHNWKKLNPKIPDHENSNEYHTNMFKWKFFNKNNTIDCALKIEIKNEKDKWKHILKVVIDC